MTKTLPKRPCGNQGLQLSAQGLGLMGIAWAYPDKTGGHLNQDEASALIHRAAELGVTHLDTSDIYGFYESETLTGKAIAGNREAYTIATKFGAWSGKGPDGAVIQGVNGDPAYVRKAVEGSLQRLGVDSIDLYYQHRVDRSRPIEETWEVLAALVKEGKVKYLGISEASTDEIRRAHKVHPISACQLEWSLWVRDVEEEIIPTLRELGIGIVAYSPLGRGFLTGTIRSQADLHESDFRVKMMPRFQKEALEKNVALLERMQALADAKGCTPGQLALAWVHLRGDDCFPIPGTKRTKYLEENAAAFWVTLSAEEQKQLEDIFAEEQITGERGPESYRNMGWTAGKSAKQ